jgi:hypothetical protein
MYKIHTYKTLNSDTKMEDFESVATRFTLDALVDHIDQQTLTVRLAAEALFGPAFWVRLNRLDMERRIVALDPAKRDLLYNMTYPGGVRDIAEAADAILLLCQDNEHEARYTQQPPPPSTPEVQMGTLTLETPIPLQRMA